MQGILQGGLSDAFCCRMFFRRPPIPKQQTSEGEKLCHMADKKSEKKGEKIHKILKDIFCDGISLYFELEKKSYFDRILACFLIFGSLSFSEEFIAFSDLKQFPTEIPEFSSSS